MPDFDKTFERITGEEYERMDSGLTTSLGSYREQFEQIQTPDAQAPTIPPVTRNSAKYALETWNNIKGSLDEAKAQMNENVDGTPKYTQEVIDNWDKYHPSINPITAGPDLEVAYATSTAPTSNPDKPIREREYICYSTEYEHSILVEWIHRYYGWVLVGGLFDKHANWEEFQTGERVDGTNCYTPVTTKIESPFTAQALATKLLDIENEKQGGANGVTFSMLAGAGDGSIDLSVTGGTPPVTNVGTETTPPPVPGT